MNAGLAVRGTVTEKTGLVVAVDPDSLSGGAEEAAAHGIPVVAEAAFDRMPDRCPSRARCAGSG